MRYKYLLPLIMIVVLFSCKKGATYSPVEPETPIVQEPEVLLKDIIMPGLPNPYYHFEYDSTGKTSFASFASDFAMYDFVYDGDRLREMRNNIFVNKDTLQYSYDDGGRVNSLRYIDIDGTVYAKVSFSYAGDKLIKLQREKRSAAGFVVDKTMEFQYHPDGNLKQIEEHRFLDPQTELITFDRFEQYDSKPNVDGFALLHSENFEHLFLLPKVRLQKNNPGILIHTGNDTNYQVDFSYTYNDKGAPTSKLGIGKWLSGVNEGQTFEYSAFFSFY